jgi:hypothetical protein
VILAALFLLLPPESAASRPAPPPPRAASVTTLGRDLVLTEPVEGRVLAALANVDIESRVSGDVVVWGGDVRFGPGGSVGGNLSVFGGRILSAGAPPVAGAVSTPGTLLHLYLAEMRRPAWSTPDSRTVWGLRLLALAAWLALSLILLRLFGSPVARAAARADEGLADTALAGTLSVLTFFLAVAAVLALLPSSVSVPIALAVAAFAVAAKVFGMGCLFLLLGQKLIRNVSAARRPAALAAGFTALAALSLVPFLGPLLWAAASLLAVGVALLSRFGVPRYSVALSGRI